MSTGQIKIILADKEEEVKGGEESILKIMEKAEDICLVVDGDYFNYMNVLCKERASICIYFIVSFILRRG